MYKIYLFCLSAFLMAHCGDNQVAPTATPVDKDREVVENITGKLVFNGVKSLESSTRSLSAMAAQACSPEGISLETLKAQWALAMTSYHFLEAVPYGPISAGKGGGCEVGSKACRIYSWPLVNPRGIRRQMKAAIEDGDDYRFRRRPGSIGLDAMEYMLYSLLDGETQVDETFSVCPYLKFVAEDLVEASADLRDAFETLEVKGLAQKSTDEEFRSDLQKIVKSFQFFEKSLLYKKVNLPLGFPDASGGKYNVKCERGEDCHFYLEHEYSHGAKEALIANIQAFQSVYEGGAGFGIYDYLVAIGEGERAERPRDLLVSLVTTLQSFATGDDFSQAVKNFDPKACGEQSLCQLQKNVKALSDWLKSDLLVLLSKELPSGVQGDND